jgi:hypothetical protein
MFNEIDDERSISNWKLTEKEIKSVAGFEDLSTEETEAVIDTLVNLALITYNIKE